MHAAYTAPGKAQVVAGAAIWAASQAVNLAVHVQLSGMRGAEGADDRAPPAGPLFALVACPNYTAEVAGWVGWSLATNIACGWAFTAVGLAQMTQWALSKLRGYRETDPAYARKRKAIIPFLI